MKLALEWRPLSEKDECCTNQQNLKQGVDNDGSLIDGCWVCSVCKKIWIGNAVDDEYLKHPLETLTEYGLAFMSACDDVIKEGKHLQLNVVLGRMSFKDLEETKKLLQVF
jgi:hypothetical protein